MTRKTFYREIKRSLEKFDEQEIRKVLEYYDEIIDDKIEAGLSEEEAIDSLGDVRNITNGIKANVVFERSNDRSDKNNSSIKNFWIILGICTSPILIPIGIGFLAGFIGILFGMIVMIVSFAGAAVAVFMAMVVTLIEVINAGASISTILVIGGGTLFLSALFALLTMSLIKISKTILNAFVRLFSKSVKNKTKKENLKYV